MVGEGEGGANGGSSMLTLNVVWIRSSRPEALAAFYNAVFEQSFTQPEPGVYAWSVGPSKVIVSELAPMTGIAKGTGRIAFRFECSDLVSEFNRLIQLQAAPIRGPHEHAGVLIATLADPDGNEFELAGPMTVS